MNVALINYESETKELVEMLLQNIETFQRAKGRISTREGQWVNASVNTSVIFLPTNCDVHGINTPSLSLWNSIDVCVFAKIARLCYAMTDDDGKFIILCVPSMQQMVFDLASAASWEYDHTLVTICKTPICLQGNMLVGALLVTVWRKPLANISQDHNKTHGLTQSRVRIGQKTNMVNH